MYVTALKSYLVIKTNIIKNISRFNDKNIRPFSILFRKQLVYF